METIKTLQEVGEEVGVPSNIIDALVTREDAIKERLLLLATQLGTDPRLVIKVLNDTGLGSPVDPERKALVDAQFQTAIAQWREHFPDFGEGLV